jgi:dipeptidyl aminopeptidase/acylaminoacyl peptidase
LPSLPIVSALLIASVVFTGSAVFADGGSAAATARLLIREGVEGSTPSWSPDGSTIAAGGEKSGVLVVAANGGAPQVLTADPYHNGPIWAPTGRRIVFVDDSAEDRALVYVVDRDVAPATPAKVLDQSDAYLASQPWSPDGRLLLFWKSSGSLEAVSAVSREIEVIDREGPCQKGEDLRDLRWNAAGSISAFCGRRLVIKAPGASSWETIERDGGRSAMEGPRQMFWWVDERDPTALVRREGTASSKIPLGGTIGAFDISQRTGFVVAAVQGRGLVILDSSGGPIGRVTPDCTTANEYIPSASEGFLDRKLDPYPRDGAPAWSPDGRRVAYVRLENPASPASLCVAEINLQEGAME